MDIYEQIKRDIAAKRGMELPQREATPPTPEAAPQVSPQALPEAAQQHDTPPSRHGLPGLLGDIPDAVNTGVVDALLQTKDFLLGTPKEDDKSYFRKAHEAFRDEVKDRGVIPALVHDISQFAVGLVGVGKLTAPIKVVQGLRASGAAGRLAYEVGQGAIAGAVVLDPHEERLSNLVQQYEPLQNPVTEFLAADPADSAALGRFKNALEGIGMDLALAGVVTASVRALKLLRSGDQAGAAKVMAEAEANPAPASVEEPSVEGATQEPQAQTVNANTQLVEPEQATSPSPTPEAPPAQVGPTSAKPEVELDVDRIIDSARSDYAAIKTYGSREAAVADGYKFAASESLPWHRLNGSDEAQAFTDNVAQSLRARLDHSKGGDVLSDTQVQAMVQQRAELYGEEPADIVGQLLRAGEGAQSMAADMGAAMLVSNKMLLDLHQTAGRYRLGLLDEWGGDAAKAGEDIKKRMAAASDVLGAALSMRAAAGRTLRRMRSEFAITPEDIERIKDMDPGKLADLLYATKGNARALVDAANPSLLRRIIQETTFSLTNSLLWLWPTHAVNMTTNLYMLAARPTEKLLGSVAMGAAGKGIRSQALHEYAFTLANLSDGWETMLETFKRGDSVLSPHGDEYLNRYHKPLPWKPVKGLPDLIENGWKAMNYRTLVGLPTRALGSVDEFMKQLRYRAVVQSKAAVEASGQGLEGDAHRSFIAKRLSEAFDADGRALDGTALQEAQVSTFQQALLPGTAGSTVQSVRASHPSVSLILPFVRTPVNVFRYAWKMTPGMNLLQNEYRRMLLGEMGEEAKAQAIGQMALGSTFMGLAASLAAEGRLTGGGPKDPALLSGLRATGWQPYSITWVGGDGKRHYFPLGRFDPLGLPMGIVADLVELQRVGENSREAEKGATALLLSLSSNFSDRSFLLSLNQALRAASDPEAHLAKFAGQTAGNAIPMSSLIRSQNPDPYMRETRGFVDSILSKLPGFSETLPPRRDAFGEVLWTRIGLATTDESDLVESEHNRIMLETGFGVRPPTPTRHGVDLRDVEVSEGRTAYDLLQEYAGFPKGHKPLKEALSQLILSKDYEGLVDGSSTVKGTKLWAISRVVEKYREAAFKRLLVEYPNVRRLVQQRQMDVKSEIRQKREENAPKSKPGAEDLLERLGYSKK